MFMSQKMCQRVVGNRGSSKKFLHASSVKFMARGVGANPNAGIMMSVSATTLIDVVIHIVAMATPVPALIVPVVDWTAHVATTSNGKMLSRGTNNIISMSSVARLVAVSRVPFWSRNSTTSGIDKLARTRAKLGRS